MSARLLSAFAASGASYAVLSHDQRLKIFATLTQQITQDCSDTQQMNVTAIAFPAASAAKSAAPASALLALGTKSGEIVLWNIAKGSVEHTLSGAHKHTGAVHSLAFAPNGLSLFSVAADRSGVKQWNVSSGAIITTYEAGEDADTASGGSFRHVCVSPDGTMLAAGGTGSLLLWHLAHSGSPLRDYQGPTDRISCVAFSPDSKYIVSGAADRYLSLWSAESDTAEGAAADAKKSAKKAKKQAAAKSADKNTPIHTFTLQTAPISVQFNQFATKGAYQIAALSDSSIVSVMQWSPNGAAAAAASSSSSSSASSSTPVSVISIPHSSSQSESSKRRDESHKSGKHKGKSTASNSTLLAGEEGDAIGSGVVQSMLFQSARSILIARGDAVRPLFQQVNFAAEDGSSFEAEITLPKYQHAHLINAAAVAAAAAGNGAPDKKRKAGTGVHSEPVTLGAQHSADRVLTAQSGLDADAAPKRAKLASAKSKSDALSRSLADRLAESEAAAASSLAAGASAFNLSTGALPKAGSLQTILQQALHSNDAALVEYCLTAGASASSSGHASLIRVTVRRLAPVYVLPLLQHLMQKFATRPNRAASLLPWLREIFNAHTAYLIRQPHLSAQLAPLSHLLDQRSAVFKKMIKLQARLDLLLGQIAHTHSKTNAADEDAESEQEGGATTGAMTTFNDGEEDDDEEDDQGRDDDEDEDGEEGEEDNEDDEEEDEEGDEHMDDEDDEEDQ